MYNAPLKHTKAVRPSFFLRSINKIEENEQKKAKRHAVKCGGKKRAACLLFGGGTANMYNAPSLPLAVTLRRRGSAA